MPLINIGALGSGEEPTIYVATSSIISITKAELKSDFLGKEYWADGMFEVTLVDVETQTNEIQVSGTFEDSLVQVWL